jgi:RAQPRD family integrative conjugative element protein
VFPVSTENDTMLLTRSLVLARCACAVLLLVASGRQAALAGDDAAEHEQLAALVRQLDLIDRLAVHAARASAQGHARYHFDYDRLREDVKRVRAGIQDYLVPRRAQPRDPIELRGDYRQSAPSGKKEAP